MRGEKKMIYKDISFEAVPFSYELFFDDRITLQDELQKDDDMTDFML